MDAWITLVWKLHHEVAVALNSLLASQGTRCISLFNQFLTIAIRSSRSSRNKFKPPCLDFHRLEIFRWTICLEKCPSSDLICFISLKETSCTPLFVFSYIRIVLLSPHCFRLVWWVENLRGCRCIEVS